MFLFKLLFCEFFLFILAFQLYQKNETAWFYVIVAFMILGLIGYIVIKRSENLIIDDEGVIIRNLNGFKNKIFWQHIKAIEPITIPISELNQNIEFTGITIDEQYEQFYFDQMTEKQINVYMDNKEKTGCGFSIIGTSNIKTLQEALYSNRAIQR